MIKWEIKPQDENLVKTLSSYGFDSVIARLLINRGCLTAEAAEEFINSENIPLLPSELLPDVEAAAEKIKNAVLQNKKITVYGDYDVDGVTSVASLVRYFRKNGVDADFYIPDRKDEGYGLSIAAIDKIKENGTEFIITVDTGTTAVAEVAYAKEIGIDIVVTDHHECSEVLPDCPVVNPKRRDSGYPFKHLAGVGVVFKLISYLGAIDEKELFDEYGVFAAIGTVADIMPLVGENRKIVTEGISVFNRRRLPTGVLSLLEKSGSSGVLDAGTIAFRIAPRLNAGGRMGSAVKSAKLLLTENRFEADALSEELCSANEERQKTEKTIISSVEKRLSETKIHNMIVEGDSRWHNGVIGIVASRLVEKYGRPTVLFSFDNGIAKGSARSIPGVSVYDIISVSSERLLKFGGHEMAAGLSVSLDKFDEFRAFIQKYADENIPEEKLGKSVITECELGKDKINLDFYESLSALEPFGAENPVPVFTVKNLEIFEITGVSQDKHCKFVFKKDDGSLFTAMCFSTPPSLLSCRRGDIVDIACVFGKNTFRGKTEVSVQIKAIKFQNDTEDTFRKAAVRFDEILSSEEKFITREDVVSVYKAVRRICGSETVVFSPLGFCRSVFKEDPDGYAKMRISLSVLTELSLIGFSETVRYGVSEDSVFSVNILTQTKKTSLEKSETFVKYSK